MCGVSCATRKATRTTHSSCCARSLRSTTASTTPRSRSRPASATACSTRCPITIHANDSRIGYSVGAGYGTDTGFRGIASLTVPRLNSYGHRFRVQMQLSQIEQTFDARYDVPFGDPALEKFSLELNGQESIEGNNVTTNAIQLGPGVTQTLGSWQRIVTSTPCTRSPTIRSSCARSIT